MKPRTLLASEVTWHLRATCCDLNPFEELAECYDQREEIQAMIDSSDGCWGWCDVTVFATWGDWTGQAHLGASSYASEEDFKDSEYYEDMLAECLASLDAQIQRAWVALNGLVAS